MTDLKQRLEQHAAAYSLLGEKDLPALLREAAASLRAAPEVEALSESDKEIALAQAVELAQYFEKNAKGRMREAATRFLSLSYAQDVAQRLRVALQCGELMKLAATFETCIPFLPAVGKKNIARAVAELRGIAACTQEASDA